MLFIPYNTDAPIYHLPIATVTIVVVNIVLWCVTVLQVILGNIDEESIRWLMLEFDTVNPLQWITGAFMHADPIHLIGNMIFLWSFGLVVEGKIGAAKFAILYLVIALFDGAFGQLPMFLLGSDEYALGASGVIFALLVIAVIWAPENEMDCFFWFLFYFGTTEVRLITIGTVYIFLQVVGLWFSGFAMSSEMLHMIGVVIGAPIGFLMLRQDLVDCEGWDLVSRNDFLQQNDLFCTAKQRKRLRDKQRSLDDPVTAALGYTQPLPIKGQRGGAEDSDESLPEPNKKRSKARQKLAKLQGVFEPPRVKQQRRAAESETVAPAVSTHPDFNRLAFTFRQAVQSQSSSVAMQTFARMDQMKLAVGLGDQSLLRFVSLLAREKKWTDALRPLNIIVSHQGELADEARLRIAQIQLKVMGKPDLALATLQQIIETAGQDAARQKVLAAKARLIQAASEAGRRWK